MQLFVYNEQDLVTTLVKLNKNKTVYYEIRTSLELLQW